MSQLHPYSVPRKLLPPSNCILTFLVRQGQYKKNSIDRTNAWWPAILLKLINIKCPKNIYGRLVAYLSDRRAVVQTNNEETCKVVTRGCPQRPMLGPILWLAMFDDILRLDLPLGCEAVAYADDVAVTIGVDTRADLKAKTRDVLEVYVSWCRSSHLEIAVSKTKFLLAKGRLKRNPVIRNEGSSVKVVDSFSYLGMISKHISMLCEKTKAIFFKLKRVVRREYGLNWRALLTIYKGIFEAATTVAAGAWYDALDKKTLAIKLLRAQRVVSISITGEYRTASADAMPVVGGIVPIDLKVWERGQIMKWKDKEDLVIPYLLPKPDAGSSEKFPA